MALSLKYYYNVLASFQRNAMREATNYIYMAREVEDGEKLRGTKRYSHNDKEDVERTWFHIQAMLFSSGYWSNSEIRKQKENIVVKYIIWPMTPEERKEQGCEEDKFDDDENPSTD